MTPTAYRLTQPLAAERPTRWDIQARYAMRIPAESVQLPAGTRLLELPPAGNGRRLPPRPPLPAGRRPGSLFRPSSYSRTSRPHRPPGSYRAGRLPAVRAGSRRRLGLAV